MKAWHEDPMASSDVFENMKLESDVMDVVRVVQAMNLASGTITKTEFELRKKIVLDSLSRFREALQDVHLTGHQALSDSHSFLSQFVEGSGAPVRRFLEETLPSAIRLMEVIQHHVTEDLERSQAFYPSSGPAAIFLGWSDPLLAFVRKVPLLFATGNAVCVKPSRSSARAVWAISQIWQKALADSGAPAGMFSVLLGRGAGSDTVGEILLKHPSFKNIHWIGRSETAILARPIALEAGKRFFFSGSGRNPAIVFAPAQGGDLASDQQLQATLQAIVRLAKDPHGWGPYRPSRLFIQESIYKKALEILQAELEMAKLGSPQDMNTEIGPIPEVSAERFQNQLKLALSETGKLVTGGGVVDRGLVQPTLVRDLTNCSTLQGEELEGVFLTAASFKYQHEAVKYANTSPLGLAGFVFHPDVEKSRSLALRLEVARLIVTNRPDRAELLAMSAPAVKNSASAADGVHETFEQGRIRPSVLG